MKKSLFLTTLLALLSLTAAAKNHIFFTQERVKLAKERIKNDREMAAYWQQIIDKADGSLNKKNVSNLDYAAVAYSVTGDKKYADDIKATLQDFAKTQTWGSEEMLARKPKWTADLGLADKCLKTALGYDAIYNDLSLQERRNIAQALYRLGVKPSADDWVMEPRRIHSLNSMGHNWWTSCACMGAILGMAIENEVTEVKSYIEEVNEVLPLWFSFAGDELQNKMRTFDRGGGMYESIGYANFGIYEAMLFRVAYKNMYPGRKIPDIPEMKDVATSFFHAAYPRTGPLYSINFGDSSPESVGLGPLALMRYLGEKVEGLEWYENQIVAGQTREGFQRYYPLGFIYAVDRAWSQGFFQRNLPPVAGLRLGHLAHAWKKDATMLAVKSGHTWNHSHADANSFILYHKGVDIIKDGGNCWYPDPNYRKYFFQSPAHNVVLFNGEGQRTYQQYHGSMLDGSLHHLLDAGSVKYVMANGTGPMADKLNRNFRHFLWMGKLLFIMDDLESYEPGEFTWVWHPGGKARNNNGRIDVEQGEAAVTIFPVYPNTIVPSNFVHDYPDNLQIETVEAPVSHHNDSTEIYYKFTQPQKVSRTKGLTVIILRDSPQDKAMPTFDRLSGEGWQGLRVHYEGRVTDIIINLLADGRLMHSNSWIEAEGWTTDSYLTAISYREGQHPAVATDFCVLYGSALRRGDQSYFASQSKLFIIKNGTDIRISGQPHYKATVGGKTFKR